MSSIDRNYFDRIDKISTTIKFKIFGMLLDYHQGYFYGCDGQLIKIK